MENCLTKICRQCNLPKILKDFYPKSRGKFGVGSECRECFKKRVTKSRKLKNMSKLPKTKNSLKMSQEYFENQIRIQGYKCAICKIEFTTKLKPCVDHCHKTGNYRGILCSSCNKALGFLNDNISSLKRAIKYLKKEVEDNIYKGRVY
jgi:hypothetical protein